LQAAGSRSRKEEKIELYRNTLNYISGGSVTGRSKTVHLERGHFLPAESQMLNQYVSNRGETKMSKKVLITLLIVIAVLATSTSVVAKGPGGGGGHETTVTNNLSVPTIMIRGGFTGITCPGGFVDPTGIPITGYEVDPTAYFYIQGAHKWQAECITATSATATAEWGDNLTGDASLKAGSPIRVELGLFDDTGLQMQGFNVVKLEPSKLDRESAYGTLATDNGEGGWYGTAEYLPVRVFDAEVTFSVKNVATGAYVVPLGSNPTAEINATGKVVYGYNLRVTAAGQYEITFVLPSVDITGVDAGVYVTDPLGADTVTLVITVGTGGGGGGRRP
jgi:hypothetical protein